MPQIVRQHGIDFLIKKQYRLFSGRDIIKEYLPNLDISAHIVWNGYDVEIEEIEAIGKTPKTKVLAKHLDAWEMIADGEEPYGNFFEKDVLELQQTANRFMDQMYLCYVKRLNIHKGAKPKSYENFEDWYEQYS